MPILCLRQSGQLIRHRRSLTVVPCRIGNQSPEAARSLGQSGVVVAQAHGFIGQCRLARDRIDKSAYGTFIHDGVLSKTLVHVVQSPGH